MAAHKGTTTKKEGRLALLSRREIPIRAKRVRHEVPIRQEGRGREIRVLAKGGRSNAPKHIKGQVWPL